MARSADRAHGWRPRSDRLRVNPETERAILDLRSGMDEAERAAFETDLRAAFSVPADRRDSAIDVVVRSWTSRRELKEAPEAPSWFV